MKWIPFVFVVPVLCAALPLLKKDAADASLSGPAFPSAELSAGDAGRPETGWTALMQAVTTDIEKVRLLLSRKADVQARSNLGNDALLLAARQPGGSAAVKLLLEHGADPNSRNVFGATPLMAAVAAEDEASVDLLTGAGASVDAAPNPDLPGFLFGGGRTPLMWAAFRRNAVLVRKLLQHGAKVNAFTGVGSALTQAAWVSDAKIARLLLDAGADVNQRDLKWEFTPLHWAAASEYASTVLVTLLLERGAEVNAAGGQPVDNFMGVPQTPVMLALQRGETAIVSTLRQAGAKMPGPAPERNPSPETRASSGTGDALAAVNRALVPLMHTAVESPRRFLAHASKQDCASCHQQHVPMLAFGAAQARGLAVDPSAAKSVMQGIEKFHRNEFGREAVFYPEPAIEFGYALMNMKAQGKPRSALSDDLIHHLLVIQAADGRWHYNFPRPPMQSTDVSATALAVRGLTLYSIPGREAEIARSIERGRAWLESALAETNEEKSYRLLGLSWARGSAAWQQEAAIALVGDQRADGGWGQLANLPADAYATGLTLYALMSSGAVTPQNEAVTRGIRFLRRTQGSDGTWHVRRRAVPFQPPMQSGFPHGADSWISSAGTSWAVLALTMAPDSDAPAAPDAPHSSPSAPAATSALPQARTPESADVEFSRDIEPVLRRSCAGCHSGEKPRGNYDVTSREALLKAGNRGEPAIDFDHPDQSTFLRAVRGEIEDMEMPPSAQRAKYPALTPEELAKLDGWIKQGAPWPQSTAAVSGAGAVPGNR